MFEKDPTVTTRVRWGGTSDRMWKARARGMEIGWSLPNALIPAKPMLWYFPSQASPLQLLPHHMHLCLLRGQQFGFQCHGDQDFWDSAWEVRCRILYPSCSYLNYRKYKIFYQQKASMSSSSNHDILQKQGVNWLSEVWFRHVPNQKLYSKHAAST